MTPSTDFVVCCTFEHKPEMTSISHWKVISSRSRLECFAVPNSTTFSTLSFVHFLSNKSVRTPRVSVFPQPKHNINKHHKARDCTDQSLTCYSQATPKRLHHQHRKRQKTLSHSPKTGAMQCHNLSQLWCARKHGLRARWTKKGQRSKNGSRAITMGSLAHLQLYLVLVSSS